MKHLLFKLQSFLVLLVFTAASAYAQKSPVDMNRFIDDLMKKMTLEEKIGQLNLPVTGEITTGQAKSSNVAKRIRAGEVGGLFNLKGVERIRDVQKQAVEESRLGIPLLFGMDVIHGYETVFPIPLGLSCTWDMKAVEESARIAAIESSADGICWTFSPMVDICRDARWGRVSEGNGEDPFLGAAIAQAMVRGYQGKDMSRNDDNPISMTVTEDVVKGKISIIKHSDNGSTQIETPEVGAEFEVYLKSSGSYENATETERDYLTCNENGFAATKMLPYGIYVVHQLFSK